MGTAQGLPSGCEGESRSFVFPQIQTVVVPSPVSRSIVFSTPISFAIAAMAPLITVVVTVILPAIAASPFWGRSLFAEPRGENLSTQ